MKIRPLFTLILLGFLALIPLAAEEFTPHPLVTELGQGEGPLDPEDFLTLSLLFSGVQEEDLQDWRSAIWRFTDPAVAQLKRVQDERVRAESLLEFLHTNLFTRYREEESRMSLLFNDGVFNCVSSSVLYMYMARKADLPVIGVATPDHAFCALQLPGEDIIDIETTNIHGFNPGEKKEFKNSFGDTTGFTYVPPGNYRQRWTVRDKELLGFILTNRISQLQERMAFAQTVPLALDRHALEQSDNSLSDLEDAFKNWGAVLNQQSRFQEGLAVMKAVQEQFPQMLGIQEIAGALLYNHILTLINSSQRDLALQEWELYRDRVKIDNSSDNRVRKMLAQESIRLALQEEDFSTALKALEAAVEEGELSQNKNREYLIYLYGKEAQRKETQQGALAAYQFLLQAPGEVRRLSRINQMIESYQFNYVVDIHNRFAAFFNKKDFDNASRVLQEGLSVFPESNQLLKDKQLLEQSRP